MKNCITGKTLVTNLHQQALDKASQGNWDGAHTIVENENDALSCLIHGYLHRVEGDKFNARYWYTRAGETMPSNSLDDEFVRLSEMVNR